MTDAASDEPLAPAPDESAETALATDSGPVEVRWAPREPVRRGLGGSALSFGIAALAGSFLVGWLAPLALIGIVIGIFAIRSPVESTRLGAWGIALSILSLIYSAGWIWFTGSRLGWW